MPALLHHETSRLNKLAAWLMTSQKAEENFTYGRIIQPLFRLAAMETCMWPHQLKRSGIYEGILSSIRGVIEPSDGHPQEELTPDFGWFRPLSFNNSTWVLYWPELEV